VLQIAALLGGILLVSYAAKERFFYDLSSITAISLLFLTFFTFALFLILLVGYGFISTFWLVAGFFSGGSWIRRRIFLWPVDVRRRPTITRGVIVASFGVFFFFSVLPILDLYLKNRTLPWPIIVYTVGAGLMIGCAVITVPLSPLPGESDRHGRRRLLSFIVLFPILTLPPFLDPLLNNTMMILNFRSTPDQLVSLNDQAYRKVSAIATYAGVPIRSCQVTKDFWVLREATVVWHGIGAMAYLRITGKPDASLLIPLPSDGVEVLNSTGIQLPQHCPWAV
jgi:hypothetical protein